MGRIKRILAKWARFERPKRPKWAQSPRDSFPSNATVHDAQGQTRKPGSRRSQS